MKKLICVLLFIAVLCFFFSRDDTVRLGLGILAPDPPSQVNDDAVRFGPGILAPDPPIQVNMVSSKSFQFKGYTITPLAKFQIKAKVLSKKNYRWDRESNTSPVDLALGWGRMSDEKILSSISVSQSNRWYYWQTDELPIPKEEIQTHSANMHLVPANRSVESMVNRVRKGDMVEFSGYLIRVDAKDGWHWVSSLSRTDAGHGSCELIWAENFEIKKF